MTAFFRRRIHNKSIMEFACMFCFAFQVEEVLADEKIYWFLNGNYLLSRYIKVRFVLFFMGRLLFSNGDRRFTDSGSYSTVLYKQKI